MWDFVPLHIFEPGELFEMVLKSQQNENIEGVSFIGGEPFLQAKGLSKLAGLCREARLTVMVFTGYLLEGLKKSEIEGSAELLANTDLLVDGPYMQDLPEAERNWAGSTNQRFHFLTDAYHSGIERDPLYRPSVEFRLGADGSLRLNGWPTKIAFNNQNGV